MTFGAVFQPYSMDDADNYQQQQQQRRQLPSSTKIVANRSHEMELQEKRVCFRQLNGVYFLW